MRDHIFFYFDNNDYSDDDDDDDDGNNNNNNNNQAVHTDREVTANRPDMTIKNKKEKTCTLVDVAIPADRNVVQKEAEKKLKYKNLCIEIQRMWNLKCTIIPVVIGATGIVTRSLRKNLEAVLGKHSIDSLQSTGNMTRNVGCSAVR